MYTMLNSHKILLIISLVGSYLLNESANFTNIWKYVIDFIQNVAVPSVCVTPVTKYNRSIEKDHPFLFWQ